MIEDIVLIQQYFAWGVWHDPRMIYKAFEVIKIFGMGGRTNKVIPRGPRRPKKTFSEL